MNTELFFWYVIIGGVSKSIVILAQLRHERPGMRWTTYPTILFSGLFMLPVPAQFTGAGVFVLAVWHTGDIIGALLGVGLDKLRVNKAVYGRYRGRHHGIRPQQ